MRHCKRPVSLRIHFSAVQKAVFSSAFMNDSELPKQLARRETVSASLDFFLELVPVLKLLKILAANWKSPFLG